MRGMFYTASVLVYVGFLFVIPGFSDPGMIVTHFLIGYCFGWLDAKLIEREKGSPSEPPPSSSISAGN